MRSDRWTGGRSVQVGEAVEGGSVQRGVGERVDVSGHHAVHAVTGGRVVRCRHPLRRTGSLLRCKYALYVAVGTVR